MYGADGGDGGDFDGGFGVGDCDGEGGDVCAGPFGVAVEVKVFWVR